MGSKGSTVLSTEVVVGIGTHSFKITGTNEDHGTATISLSFSISENHKPQASDIPSGIVLDGPGQSKALSLNEWFTDPDGDAITFDASLDAPELSSLEISGGNLTLTAKKSGISTLHITASDGLESSEVHIPLAVKDPSKPVSVNPVVATEQIDILVDAAEMMPVNIDIYSSTGAKVLSKQKEGDIFHPVNISVKGIAPGHYTGKVSFDGTVHTIRFTKV